MRSRLFPFLVFFILALVINPALAQDKEAWQHDIDEGKKALVASNYSSAERSFRSAAKEASLFGTSDRKIAISAYYLAEVFNEQGRSGEAKRLYGKTLRILEKTDGPDSTTVATVLVRQGYIAVAERNWSTAERVLGRALPIVRRSWDSEDSELIRIEYIVALLEAHHLRYRKAEEDLKRVIPRLISLYGSKDHASVINASKTYAEALEKNGKSGEAARVRSELGTAPFSEIKYKPVLEPENLTSTTIFIGNKAIDKDDLEFLEDDVLVPLELLPKYLSKHELKPLTVENGKVVYGSVGLYEGSTKNAVPLFRLLQAIGLKAHFDSNLGTVDFLNPKKTARRHSTVTQNKSRRTYNRPTYSSSYRSSSSSRSSSSGGSVQVKGYYRKDGTYVRPHTRRRPSR